MKVLAKLNFRPVLYVGVLEVLAVILLCYILAVSLQHKPVWLPTISECGELSPEKHFFRWGIMLGGLLLMLEALMLYLPKKVSTLVFVLGLIAGFALTGVAVVASNEDLQVHLVFALSFFGIEDLMVLLMVLEGYRSMSYRSLAVKIPSIFLAISSTVLRFLLVFKFTSLPEDKVPWIAIIEWINVLALLAFHLSLSGDMSDLYLAELQDDDATHAMAEKSSKQKELQLTQQ